MTTTPDVGRRDQTFDYVIVGAGASAMGLVHGLLSRYKRKGHPPFTIAVLERGPWLCDAATKPPSRWCSASHYKSNSVELHDSVVIGNRHVDIPVGKGLGGTTNINACLCTPPAADDFDSWPAPWNESIAQSIAALQDEMSINGALYTHNVGENPYESNEDSKNVNGPTARETVFPSLVTNVPLSVAPEDNGPTYVRRNYFESLVQPILKENPKLSDSVSFLCDFEVQRLLFDEHDSRVIGIEGPTSQHAVYARREVILCAGAIESPVMLLVSGMGHEQDLNEIDVIPKRKGSSGVGRRLRDHVLVPRVFLSPWTPPKLSPNGVHALCHISENDYRFQLIFNDSAVYSQLVPQFIASFIRRRICKPRIIKSTVNFLSELAFQSLRLILFLLVSCTPLYFVLRYFVVTINIALLNPKSTGTVSIRQRRNDEPLRRQNVQVIIHAGYLNDPNDIKALWEGWKMSSEQFELFLDQCIEVLPGFLFQGFATGSTWFASFATHFALPYFHWCGTCAMKTEGNDEWVVDANLRMRDVGGLRVCDASVFPTTISGPTALTCAALGHSFARVLISTNKKKCQ